MSNNGAENTILNSRNRSESKPSDSQLTDVTKQFSESTKALGEFMLTENDDSEKSDKSANNVDSIVDVTDNKIKIPFTEFYTENFLHFKRLAFLMLNNKEIAEDVVQDSFLAIYPRYFKLENPEGYLRVVVINRCKTALKKRVYDNKKMSKIANTTSTEMESDLNSSEFLDHLDVLTIKQKTAVILRYYLRFSDAQIANIIKCRSVSVSKIISRALDTLKQNISLEDF